MWGCKSSDKDDSSASVSHTDSSSSSGTSSPASSSSSETSSSSVSVPVEAITLNETTAELEIGESITLIATIFPLNATETQVIWETNNSLVADVNNGTVIAKSVGVAIIQARIGKVTATCEVSVKEKPFVSDEVKEEGYIWHETFDAVENVPNYLNYTTSGGGVKEIIKDDGGKQYLQLSTNGTGSAFVDYALKSDVLHGKVVAETRVQITSELEPFYNTFFLYTADNTPVLTLGMFEGFFQNHNGTKWTRASASYNANEWYEIRLVMDFDAKTYLFELNGEVVNGALTFRNPDLSDKVSYLRIGSDKQDSAIMYDYIKLSYATQPTVTINNNQGEINLNDDSVDEFILDYTVQSKYSQTPVVSVVCSEQNGYAWVEQNKKVRFTASGNYVFTVTVTDIAGSCSDNITVTVTGYYSAPEIILNSNEKAKLSVTGNNTYKFDYVVNGSPAPSLVISGVKNGVTVFDDQTQTVLIYDEATKTIKFLSAGVYTFTLKATNSQGEATKTVEITVEDKYKTPDTVTDDMKIYYDEFEQIPEGVTSSTGTGLISVENGQIKFITGTTSGSCFLHKNLKGSFVGVVTVEMAFSFNHELDNSSFSNLMFITSEDGTINVTNFAIDYGYLKCRTGSSWLSVRYNGYEIRLVKGANYGIKVVNDFNSKVSCLYLVGEQVDLYSNGALIAPQTLGGEIYLGEFAFRNPQTEAVAFRVGTEKTFANYSVDYVHIYSLSPVINVSETSKIITNFEDTANYTLAYESSSEVAVACDKTDGFTLNDKEVTFTKAGIYVFTLTSSNGYGTTKKTITVEVVDSVVTETESIISVDFKNSDTRPEAPTGTGSATAIYNEKGLTISTSSSSGSLYYQKSFGKALTGIVTTDISFSIGLNNKQFLNIFFLFNSSFSGNPVANVAVSSVNNGTNTYIQYRGGSVTSWKNQMYDGKLIELIKGDENFYTLRVICDFENKQLYIYLFESDVLLGGEQTDISENGIYIGSYGFRTPGSNAEGFRCGVDNKSSTEFTISSINMYRSNLPVFATEPTDEKLTIADGKAETTLSYVLLNGTAVISCEQEGVEISGDKITIFSAGEYTFTITASNDILEQKVIKTFKIIVTEPSE